MKTKKDLIARIHTAVYQLTAKRLPPMDRIRIAAIIESYLFVLGQFDDGTLLSDIQHQNIEEKFLWFKTTRTETYVECMVRLGNEYLNTIII